MYIYIHIWGVGSTSVDCKGGVSRSTARRMRLGLSAANILRKPSTPDFAFECLSDGVQDWD